MTQNKIAPMTTIIRIPIINVSTGISYHVGGAATRGAPSLAKKAAIRD
jgi:hypothetical protein